MQTFARTIHQLPFLAQRSIGRTRDLPRNMAACSFKPRTVAAASVARTALDETGAKGEFKRTDAGFRNFIEPGTQFAPEANRYVLYISYACPWANRCLAVLLLKGLRDSIDVVVVHPTWQRTRPDIAEDEHTGWALVDPSGPPLSSSTGFGSFGNEGCTADKYNNASFIRDLYEKSNDTTGMYCELAYVKTLGAFLPHRQVQRACLVGHQDQLHRQQ